MAGLRGPLYRTVPPGMTSCHTIPPGVTGGLVMSSRLVQQRLIQRPCQGHFFLSSFSPTPSPFGPMLAFVGGDLQSRGYFF